MRRTLRILLPAGLLAILALPVPGLLGALRVSAAAEFRERPSQTREYATIARHLHQTFRGYGRFSVLEPQFAIVALSHMAAGLYNVALAEPERRAEVLELTREVVRRGLSPEVSPSSRPTSGSTHLDDHNLFWSHLGVILGVNRLLEGSGARVGGENLDTMQERIVRHLRARSMASPLFHAPSYPGSAMWPADQTVTLLAIKLFDEARKTTLHQEPLRGFLRVMSERRDSETGLYRSSVSPVSHAKTPRGCAASWAALYLAQLDGAVAYEQYARARQHLGRTFLGMGGFREWPLGHGGGTDSDSGPVVFGIGAAATGLGLGPARLFGDAATYTAIRRSALVLGLPSWRASGGYLLSPVLGEAILLHGRTARPWFGQIPRLPFAPVPFATAPLLLLGLDLAFMLLIVWRVLRPRRAKPSLRPSRPRRR